MSEPKKLKVEFAPGVLEELEADMNGEDLQDLMDKIKEALEDEDQFEVVDMEALKVDDPNLYATLQEKLINFNAPKRTLH